MLWHWMSHLHQITRLCWQQNDHFIRMLLLL